MAQRKVEERIMGYLHEDKTADFMLWAGSHTLPNPDTEWAKTGGDDTNFDLAINWNHGFWEIKLIFDDNESSAALADKWLRRKKGTLKYFGLLSKKEREKIPIPSFSSSVYRGEK